MPEPDLTLPMSKLKGWTGDLLGWGLGADMGEEAWTTAKQARIDEYCDAALRMVYFEASIDPANISPHQWSFLTPDLLLTVPSGTTVYDLPDDYAGFADDFLTVTLGDTGGIYARVKITASAYIDQLFAQTASASGRPRCVSERWVKDVTATRSNKSQLYIYPTTDAAYTFRGPYNIIPDRLTSSAPFAYGGATMAECFKAACRAAAEMQSMGLRPGEGAEWPNYQRCLAIAINRDGRHASKNIGVNRDRSDPSRRTGVRWRGDTNGAIGYVGNLTIDGERPSEA